MVMCKMTQMVISTHFKDKLRKASMGKLSKPSQPTLFEITLEKLIRVSSASLVNQLCKPGPGP